MIPPEPSESVGQSQRFTEALLTVQPHVPEEKKDEVAEDAAVIQPPVPQIDTGPSKMAEEIVVVAVEPKKELVPEVVKAPAAEKKPEVLDKSSTNSTF